MVAPPAVTRRTSAPEAFAVFPFEAAAAHRETREHHRRPRSARRWLLQSVWLRQPGGDVGRRLARYVLHGADRLVESCSLAVSRRSARKPIWRMARYAPVMV